MARDLLNRYIWIINTIRRFGRITRKELDDRWSRSPYSNGETKIPRRTFYNYRQAIEELFSLSIQCDPSTYEYFIDETDSGNVELTDWLLHSSATSNVLQGSRDIAGRILLEEVPSAGEHLAGIMEALRENHPVRFDYHPYTRVNPNRGVELEPYFLRIYRQLWYVAGRNVADNKLKTYALDRMTDLTVSTETFVPPEGLDPKEYFRDSFGIMVNRAEAKDVTLRVEARQAKYLRALPLHHSQREMVNDKYSIFTYRLRLTPDFVAEILSHGADVTVVGPPELKVMVTTALRDALANYGLSESGESEI